MDIGKDMSVVVAYDPDREYVHDIFAAPTADFPKLRQRYEAAGFQLIHESGEELSFRTASMVTLLPPQVRVDRIEDDETTFERPGDISEDTPVLTG